MTCTVTGALAIVLSPLAPTPQLAAQDAPWQSAQNTPASENRSVTNAVGGSTAENQSATDNAAADNAAADGARWHYINVPRFTIPFHLKNQVNIARVQLFASADGGKTWNMVGDQDPREGRFAFEPGQDGEYWLSSRTVDHSNRVYGSSHNGTPVPTLKVVVDRRRPTLKLEARPEPSGRIHLIWDATDSYLDPQSLRIEYRAGADGPWQAIPLKADQAQFRDGRLRGEMYWYPNTMTRVLTIRGEVRDKAQNREVELIDRVFLPRVADRGQPPRDASSGGQPTESQELAQNVWPREEQRPLGGLQNDTANAQPERGPDLGTRVNYGPVASDVRPGMGDNVRVEPTQDQRRLSLYETGFGIPPQMTKNPRFHLEYDLQFVGPEGVADVQLWCTVDRGETWEKWGSDPDLKSPLDVKVNTEGLYGFCIVIIGKNGLSSPVPKSKTPADLWVGVDLTDPEGRLTSAEIGRGAYAGHVVLTWQAQDASLADKPITLSFSANREGPWQVIAANLANDGQYHWKIDNSIPSSAYIKMDVVDKAGRRISRTLDEPIDTRQVAPRGRIRGVRPADR